MDKKNVFVGVLITALTIIVTALVTPLGGMLKDIVFPTKYFYECNIVNAGKPLNKIPILLDEKDSTSTDSDGKFIFANIKKGIHKYIVFFHNQSYPFEFISSDKEPPKEAPKDLSTWLIPDSTVTPETKKMAASLPPTPQVAEAVEPKRDSVPAATTVVNTGAQMRVMSMSLRAMRPAAVADISAGSILDTIVLRVKKDFGDKHGSQSAYHYYISGPADYLNMIKEVHYTRNHNSFPEFSSNSFVTGADRSNNFDYTGYQWGYITTAYVSIELKNGSTSQRVLKTINYDN